MADISRIQLDRISDISRVEQLHEKLETLLSEGNGVEINASAVERIDTASLQLLTAFVRTVAKHHIDIRIIQPSASFTDTVRLMGLENALALQH